MRKERFQRGSELTTNRRPRLTREEEIGLGRRNREEADITARNALVESHLGFVFLFTKKFRWSKMEFDDLAQCGNIGLITAASKYDERVGRFSTYARWWIESSIREAIQASGFIRLPANIHNQHREILKTARTLAEELGRVPTLTEVAFHLNVSLTKVKDTLSWMKMNIVSLDAPLSNSDTEPGEGTIGSVIPDSSMLRQDFLLEAHDELRLAHARIDHVRERLVNGLHLSERDQLIFKRFHGLDMSERSTLEELSGEVGVSKQRVQQVLDSIWKRISKEKVLPHRNPLLADIERIAILEELVGG